MQDHKVFNSIKFFGGANKFVDLPKNNLIEVAFWGRSNVGKSSTINSIFNNKTVARVSQTPGRTQQINLFTIGDNIATIADLPGYGYAKVSKSVADNLHQLCYDYLHNRSPVITFVLIDARRGFMEVDNDVIEAMDVLGRKVCLVFTKTDLVSENIIAELKQKTFGRDFLMISNRSKNGITNLRKKIIDAINETKNKSRKSI
jgi:GTP-binding protein